jgi:hypothetical protein
VALRFDRDKVEIYELLLDLSVQEGLTDAEIASKLGVSLVTAGSWRRRLGIPINHKFFHHFDLNYGEGAADEFRRMLLNGATYAFIGKYFGFSRQRALQIAQQHFMTEKEAAYEERAEKKGDRSRGSAA